MLTLSIAVNDCRRKPAAKGLRDYVCYPLSNSHYPISLLLPGRARTLIMKATAHSQESEQIEYWNTTLKNCQLLIQLITVYWKHLPKNN